MSVYRKAAEKIINKECSYCCLAIERISYNDGDLLKFKYFFEPGEYSLPDWFGSPRDEKNRLARSLALLFMEQIEKDKKN